MRLQLGYAASCPPSAVPDGHGGAGRAEQRQHEQRLVAEPCATARLCEKIIVSRLRHHHASGMDEPTIGADVTSLRRSRVLVVRGNVATTGLMASVRAALRRADPNLPVANFRTMEQLVDRSVFARRFVVMLVAGFAVFGVVLSALGVYAVLSYSVSQRTQEIGIRMALGATADGVRRGILAETGRLALLGLTIGVPLSMMAARGIRGLLYDVAATDAVTFGAVLVLLVGVAMGGGYLPARRATRVDPANALKPR